MINILHKLKVLQYDLTPDNDKLGHFFWGFIYCLIGLVIDYFIGKYAFILIVPFLIGGLSELVDGLSGKGNVEFWDIIYTISPSIIIYIICLIN